MSMMAGKAIREHLGTIYQELSDLEDELVGYEQVGAEVRELLYEMADPLLKAIVAATTCPRLH